MTKKCLEKRPKRQIKDTILIVCSGDTEKVYFDNFKSKAAKINIETYKKTLSPKKLVELVLKKMTGKNYLQVWVVFDRDEFEDFDEAIELAANNYIRVAYSNQAFELWFLLHFERIEGKFHRKYYEQEINKLMKRTADNHLYKPYYGIYKLLKNKIDKAITNSKLGHQKHIRDNSDKSISEWESCTTVYQLVEMLIKIQ